FLAVLQGFAVYGLHFATSGEKYGVGSSGVPFAGGAHAGIDVGVAFGDSAELQGAAGLHGFVIAQGFDEGAGFIVQVVFAGYYALGAFRLGHADAMDATRSVTFVGALT